MPIPGMVEMFHQMVLVLVDEAEILWACWCQQTWCSPHSGWSVLMRSILCHWCQTCQWWGGCRDWLQLLSPTRWCLMLHCCWWWGEEEETPQPHQMSRWLSQYHACFGNKQNHTSENDGKKTKTKTTNQTMQNNPKPRSNTTMTAKTTEWQTRKYRKILPM